MAIRSNGKKLFACCLSSIRHPFVSFSTAGVIHSEKSSAVQMAAAIHSKKKKQPS